MKEIIARILHGFRIPLDLAFEGNLLSPDILNGDDWQLIDFEQDAEAGEIIQTYVKNNILKDMLLREDDQWYCFILTSLQEDCNPAKSFLFIYNYEDTLPTGDYVTIEISDTICTSEALRGLKNVPTPQGFRWEYRTHYIMQTSY